MIVAKVKISGANAVATDKRTVTAGMVGAQVQLEYTDPVWEGLHKTVVFYGATVKDVITDDTLLTVPAEVIAKPNVHLTIGVYGVDAEGCVVIPTLLADLGIVRVGANPSGDTSTNPTLPVWAQVQQLLDTLANAADSAAGEALAAAGEARQLVEDIRQRIARGDLNGNPGATPNIRIGEVETLAAGSDATASIDGTAENPLLNLGIPEGRAGDTPVKGKDYYTDADREDLIDDLLNTDQLKGMIKTINGAAPDENGNLDIDTGSGCLPLPPIASVGQIIAVSSVDENGAVTATEAVDLEVLEDAEGMMF